jgi:hypothetical protein
MNRTAVHENVVVVPWPGHLHLHSGSAYFSEPFNLSAVAERKSLTAMESFATRFPIRKTLQTQCGARPGECEHYEPKVGGWGALGHPMG